ncbi:MAG: cell division protein ZapA [Candidatus Electrothrix sp. LOE2]|jgi:cell division protein ZapA|nr:cell division protein ZapA [Candidatus Electrothrix sp. LOE2]
MEERLISFTLYGQEFSFYSDVPDDEVQEAVSMLRQELGEPEKCGPTTTVPSSTLLVLACLRIASRHVSLKRDFDRFHADRKKYKRSNELISGLIGKISTALDK